jgi:potassium-transporting ATPase KdpC subunit
MKMLRLLIVLTLICGVIYPLTVTLVSRTFFSQKAMGSLIQIDGKVIGSSLLAQKFSRADFFHSRPSAADFATVASGASQSSPTQKSGTELLQKRRAEAPTSGTDAWTTSGSGLDPHISPKTAYGQIQRVASARGLAPEKVSALVDKYTEKETFGIWGQPRVNVLELNIALMNSR